MSNIKINSNAARHLLLTLIYTPHIDDNNIVDVIRLISEKLRVQSWVRKVCRILAHGCATIQHWLLSSTQTGDFPAHRQATSFEVEK